MVLLILLFYCTIVLTNGVPTYVVFVQNLAFFELRASS